jgi:hypothetical protein
LRHSLGSGPIDDALAVSNFFWLTEARMARLQPFFPKSQAKLNGDDRFSSIADNQLPCSGSD